MAVRTELWNGESRASGHEQFTHLMAQLKLHPQGRRHPKGIGYPTAIGKPSFNHHYHSCASPFVAGIDRQFIGRSGINQTSRFLHKA